MTSCAEKMCGEALMHFSCLPHALAGVCGRATSEVTQTHISRWGVVESDHQRLQLHV